MLDVLTDGRGEDVSNSCIVTAHRGYGKSSFMELLSEFRFGSVCLMLDHLLRVHPFVAASYLSPGIGDIMDVDGQDREENEMVATLVAIQHAGVEHASELTMTAFVQPQQ
eukprot:gb/GEZJ01004605.1/.p3 GENE.gb/GEZJ01004605.1/~~gb/GEZJ01004605.1/.p3  ORF type:complete len:110 (-),score=9.38 gb/GEZJ01004605.1/:679-1008(-)